LGPKLGYLREVIGARDDFDVVPIANELEKKYLRSIELLKRNQRHCPHWAVFQRFVI